MYCVNSGNESCADQDQAFVDDVDVVSMIDCEWAVRSAEQVMLRATSPPSVAARLAETSLDCISMELNFADADASHDASLKPCLPAPIVATPAVNSSAMNRFLCHAGGFEYEEPGFRCWISFCRCPGDTCCNMTSPPPTAFERRMCQSSMANIVQSLIDQARTKESQRRAGSAAKDAAAAARASGPAAAARPSQKRGLASTAGAAAEAGKRGRPGAR